MNNLTVVENGLVNVYSGDNEERIVSGRELREFLGVSTNYTTWFKRMCEYGFEEGVDYAEFWSDEGDDHKPLREKSASPQKMAAMGYSIEHHVGLMMAKAIAQINKRHKNSSSLYEFLCGIEKREIFVQQQPRKEYSFGEMLDEITGKEWVKQYPIDSGKYFLDFYLEDILIVEYQEEYHKHQKDEDIKRILYCREWIAKNEGCALDSWRTPVIFVEEGKELEGLNRIIRHLVGFGEIDDWNYNLEPCDIGNK